MSFKPYKLKYAYTPFSGAKGYWYGSTSIIASVQNDEYNVLTRVISFSTHGGSAELPEEVKKEILYYLGMDPEKIINHFEVGIIDGHRGNTKYYIQPA